MILGGFVLRDREKLAPLVEGAIGVLLLGLPLLRLVMGGPGWSVAISAGQPIIAAADSALLLAGGWVIARVVSRRAGRIARRPALLQAAGWWPH